MAADDSQPEARAKRQRKGKAPQPTAPREWTTNADGSLVNWKDEAQVREKIATTWTEGWDKEIPASEYIESRALKWVRELEQISDVALQPLTTDTGPDYDLAAKIKLSLVKLSSANRQRVDLTAQIALTAGPDLKGLSDAELKAIELGSPEQLNELALRIGQLKSARKQEDD